MNSLHKKEFQVLQDIMDISGKDIPHVSELEQNSAGHVSDNEQIVELSLSSSDISHILSPSNSHPAMSYQRIKWMVEATKKFGEYPLRL